MPRPDLFTHHIVKRLIMAEVIPIMALLGYPYESLKRGNLLRIRVKIKKIRENNVIRIIVEGSTLSRKPRKENLL